LSGQSDLIERYARGGGLLKYAAQGMTPEHQATRIGPGQWSPAEVVAHLLDSDLVLADRLKRLIAEENPVLQAFDEQAWLTRLDSQSMPVDEAVALFSANRQWMTRILERCTESDFARTGMHSETGRQTLASVLAKTVSHLDHHLKFLYGKRAALGDAVPPRYSED